jgi:hypothetical protein
MAKDAVDTLGAYQTVLRLSRRLAYVSVVLAGLCVAIILLTFTVAPPW